MQVQAEKEWSEIGCNSMSVCRRHCLTVRQRVEENFRDWWIGCVRWKLKVNAGKSKVMVFEKREVEV